MNAQCEDMERYPSEVKTTKYGKGLFTTRDVSANTILEQFQGPGEPFLITLRS